jgi:hypothetical protein
MENIASGIAKAVVAGSIALALSVKWTLADDPFHFYFWVNDLSMKDNGLVRIEYLTFLGLV